MSAASDSPRIQWRIKIPNFATQTEADRHYLTLAFALRDNSDDPKAKTVSASGVGAVIATRLGEISRSANVLPPKLKHYFEIYGKLITEEDRYYVIEHAERAAIFNAYRSGNNLEGATLYCTRFPCSDCARAIVWSGISRVVTQNGFSGEKRWIDAQKAALRILRESGVTVRYMSISPSQ